MKHSILFSLLLIYLPAISQLYFEPGYIIDKNELVTNCLIKNIDWKNNPKSIEYKLSETEEVLKGDLSGLLEFGITGQSKYIAAEVQVDRSTENLNRMGYDKKPNFSTETVFLRTLIEGTASLFEYQDGDILRFYFSTPEHTLAPLVYKRYKVSGTKIGKNNRFRQQLVNALKCDMIDSKMIDRLNYNRKGLTKLFIKYNKCVESEITNYEIVKTKSKTNINIRPRINMGSISYTNLFITGISSENGYSPGYGLGIEIEHTLPFNKSKWAVIFEPSYQKYSTENTIMTSNISGGSLTTKINYQSIELAAGARYYMFLNDKSRLFINATLQHDVSFGANVVMTRSDESEFGDFGIIADYHLAGGIGYKHNDRLSFELRYQTAQEVLGNNLGWDTKFRTLSAIFSYTLN